MEAKTPNSHEDDAIVKFLLNVDTLDMGAKLPKLAEVDQNTDTRLNGSVVNVETTSVPAELPQVAYANPDSFHNDDAYLDELEVPDDSDDREFVCSICFDPFLVTDGCVTCRPFDGTAVDAPCHSLCVDCARGYAHSAITGSFVAKGGIGLICIDKSCSNVFLRPDFELYLSPDDYLGLSKRFQSEDIAAANVTLHSCSCGGCGIVPLDVEFYTCEECGQDRCTHCQRPYDELHRDKTCEEVAQVESEDREDTRRNEIIVRTCHRCQTQFVKRDACNHMECRCGATQCYICRAPDIGYDHFCGCDSGQKHGHCNRCGKNCRVWENADEFDRFRLQAFNQNPDDVQSASEFAANYRNTKRNIRQRGRGAFRGRGAPAAARENRIQFFVRNNQNRGRGRRGRAEGDLIFNFNQAGRGRNRGRNVRGGQRPDFFGFVDMMHMLPNFPNDNEP